MKKKETEIPEVEETKEIKTTMTNKSPSLEKSSTPEKQFTLTSEQVDNIQKWANEIATVTDGKVGTLDYIFKENYDTRRMEVFVHSEKINFTKKVV